MALQNQIKAKQFKYINKYRILWKDKIRKDKIKLQKKIKWQYNNKLTKI